MPGLGPGTPLRFTSGLSGGAKRLPAAAAVGVAAAFVSDVFAAGDASLVGSEGAEAVDEADFGCDGIDGDWVDGNLAS